LLTIGSTLVFDIRENLDGFRIEIIGIDERADEIAGFIKIVDYSRKIATAGHFGNVGYRFETSITCRPISRQFRCRVANGKDNICAFGTFC
jgi:hypothetical protein